nr:MAG TPA: hypothetical protein [Caudoviricetes sp.]
MLGRQHRTAQKHFLIGSSDSCFDIAQLAI